MLDQNLDEFSVTKERGERECRELVVSRNIWIGATLEQCPNHSRVTVTRRPHQRSHAMFIAGVDVCAAQKHSAQLFDITRLSNAP
jgi:hypothetical protein